jgi:hypothetical protein
MSYRTDRYEIGDLVVPDKGFHSYYVIEELGDGPFKVKNVIEIPEQDEYEYDYSAQSPRSSVGHVQQIVLENVNYGHTDDDRFSVGHILKKFK